VFEEEKKYSLNCVFIEKQRIEHQKHLKDPPEPRQTITLESHQNKQTLRDPKYLKTSKPSDSTIAAPLI